MEFIKFSKANKNYDSTYVHTTTPQKIPNAD